MGAHLGLGLTPRTSTLLHHTWDVLVGAVGAGPTCVSVGARVTRVAGAGGGRGASLRRIGVVRTRSTSIRTRESHQSVRACQTPGVVISTRVSCARRNRQGARNTCWTGRAGAAHRTSVAGLAVQVLWRRKDRESEHANEIDREREKGKVRQLVISLHSRLLYQF